MEVEAVGWLWWLWILEGVGDGMGEEMMVLQDDEASGWEGFVG